MEKTRCTIWLTVITFLTCSSGSLQGVNAWSWQGDGPLFGIGQGPGMLNVTEAVTARTILKGGDDYANHIRMQLAADDDQHSAQIEEELQKIWGRMNAAAQNGDINTLIKYFSLDSQERYRNVFTQMGASALPKIFSSIEMIHVLEVRGHLVEAEALRTENGTKFSYPITFIEEQDGVWKVDGM
jgi:hypothetical protein